MLGCSPWFSILWWLRFGAVLILIAIPAAARAQDSSTEARLDRIERDLNMLERQVYRGAPAAMPAPGGGGGGATTAADVEIRVERVEAQMRDLTGRVEEISNGIDQLKQRIEQINSDNDVRFSQLSGGTTSAGTSPPYGRSPAGDTTRLAAGTPPTAGMPPGTVVPPPSGGGLNPIFGTLSPPGTAPPRSSPESASTESPPPLSGSINEQFNRAFGLLKQADYEGAEAALKAFIEAHPNDLLAGNAQYWLGQTYFARNRYPEAASAFAEGYKRFPKGVKAPEDLLYLGMSLAKADQKKSACLALAQLDQAFPNPSAAIRERATAERRRIGCS
jgi:tol-pal system protein YbgF